MEKVVILARVSTMHQDYDRQVSELVEYASLHNMKVAKVFANKISGAKRNSERQELIELIEYVKDNNISKVLVVSICRLGRDTGSPRKVVELCINIFESK